MKLAEDDMSHAMKGHYEEMARLLNNYEATTGLLAQKQQ
jgi:hypothetical protein